MSDELITRLSTATCVADVRNIAAELGKELSTEDAEAIFAEVKRANPSEGELSDETLMAVSGGWQIHPAWFDHWFRGGPDPLAQQGN